MKNPLCPIFAAFALALLPLAAPAQEAYPTRALLATATTVVGEPLRYPTGAPARVTASIVTIAPGADTPLHRHPVPLVAYILAGELTVDYGSHGSHGKRSFRKGDAFVEAMDVAHRGMNLGAEGIANVVLEK